MAGPGAGLTLPVALEEVAHTLGVPLRVLGLPLHDHNLPGQVANDAGRGEGGVPDLAKVLNLEGDDGLGPGLVPVVHSLPLLGRLCAAALLHGAASHGLLFRGGGGLRRGLLHSGEQLPGKLVVVGTSVAAPIIRSSF